MRKSFIFNALSDRYSKDYRSLPPTDDITLPPLQYEPEEQRQDIQIHPADKKGWLYYVNQASSRSTTKLKKFWAILRRLGDEADGDTGYHLELYKDEKDSRKAKSCPKVCLFIADPIIEARAALQSEEGVKSRSRSTFELIEMHNDQIVSNALFGCETDEERNHWVDRINEALAVTRRNDGEGSEPEDELDEDKLNARVSAQQNSVIFSYIQETKNLHLIEQKRKKNRIRLMHLSKEHHQLLYGDTSADKSDTPPPSKSIRFIVEALKLQFHLRGCVRDGGREPITNLEPFFVTFALYDAAKKKKISSDFHAQFNHSYVKDMCNPTGNNMAMELFGEPERKKINFTWIENPKKGIFEIANPHAEIYLVARIERVLMGGI